MVNKSDAIPSPDEFMLITPLYLEFDIYKSNFEKLRQIENFKGPLDAYCVECERDSVFRDNKPQSLGYTPPPQGISHALGRTDSIQAKASSEIHAQMALAEATKDRIISLHFECGRNKKHTLNLFIRVQNNTIMKIGQYPSLADLQSTEIGKYRKVLGDIKYRELSRAIGLNAHGIGVGAFVYLRRIFEDLIEEAHTKAKEDSAWNEETFLTSRMDEKIKMLRDLLPEFLVQNTSIYSILSKGLHSLTEEECQQHFEILRTGIELILDEKIEREERDKKTTQAKKDLDKIKGSLTP